MARFRGAVGPHALLDPIEHVPETRKPAPAGHVAELDQQERVPFDPVTDRGGDHRVAQEQLTSTTMTAAP